MLVFPPSCSQNLGYAGVPIAVHALWAVGAGILFVVLWEFSGFFINALGNSLIAVHVGVMVTMI